MRMLMVVLAAALLAGCAGSVMNDARTQSPDKVLTSDKPEKDVARCVQFAWQDEAVFGVDAAAYVEPRKSGGTIARICLKDLGVPPVRLIRAPGRKIAFHQARLEVKIDWMVLNTAPVFGDGAVRLISRCEVVTQS